ncbi:MAG: glycosyltransferase [Chloroflexi bacterium]|nr:glycosyltransferase [Chloroflexota bacterium]
MLINALSAGTLVVVLLCLAYLLTLAVASAKSITTTPSQSCSARFAVVVPAHNEAAVIGATVRQLRQQTYQPDRFDIHVIADHCADQTVGEARIAGAICWERTDGERHGKGAALAWQFERLFASAPGYDAVVVFDADTRVDPAFLSVMDARLAQGAEVIQGCHRIVNPNDSWFAALTWAMFMIDNRIQNHGRVVLGWSAKNMGDSICYRANVLKRLGWGTDLTEDYKFRQRLLLDGICIAYEPGAIGYGEAPVSWAAARAQRSRWLRGAYTASRQNAMQMLREGLRRRDSALLDGAAQAVLPSYSTLTLLAAIVFAAHVLAGNMVSPVLSLLWGIVLAVLVAYPLWGLALERAPARAYLVMLLGPVFIVWRTWLSLRARLGGPVDWVRTARRAESKLD